MKIEIIPPFKFAEEKEYTSPDDCIEHFVTQAYSKPTFWIESSLTQCKAGAHRSVQDIYNYVITRFPSTTLEDVVKTLFDLHVSRKIKGWYCADINRFVFRPSTLWDCNSILNRICPSFPGLSYEKEEFERWREYFDTVLGPEWRNDQESA